MDGIAARTKAEIFFSKSGLNLEKKEGFAGNISTLAEVQIQPGSILDREVNDNRPTILQE
jgi:hypothetical protein